MRTTVAPEIAAKIIKGVGTGSCNASIVTMSIAAVARNTLTAATEAQRAFLLLFTINRLSIPSRIFMVSLTMTTSELVCGCGYGSGLNVTEGFETGSNAMGRMGEAVSLISNPTLVLSIKRILLWLWIIVNGKCLNLDNSSPVSYVILRETLKLPTDKEETGFFLGSSSGNRHLLSLLGRQNNGIIT